MANGGAQNQNCSQATAPSEQEASCAEHKLLDVEAEDWVGSGIEEEIVAF